MPTNKNVQITRNVIYRLIYQDDKTSCSHKTTHNNNNNIQLYEIIHSFI